ncbi:hypothetical protein DFJ73DRAFT_635772 [Zopfochytrium polystomum]|nr:hypothetical protein DFJ73DRAFT_635772 [Zopfochytrium polystomum]
MLAAHDLTDTHASLPIFQFESLVEGHPLLVMAFHLFERDGLVETFSIDREVLVKSILLVEEGYRSDVPFHNALHAADVLHATALLASMIVPNLAPYQLLALYISALIHDHGHPGLTNTFLTSTSDPLALLYNDRSVLESHHCASGWDALVIRGGMLDFLDEPTKRTVRGLVVDMVMATDLSGHSKLLESFVVASQNVTCAANPSTADMELVMKMILKCADVSNPTRPWDVCYTWTRRLLTEWSRQGDLERHLGLPVSRFMDRRTISLELPQCQLGFIDFIVRPSLSALGTWVGAQAATGSSRTDGIQSLLARLEENRAEWMRLDDAGDGCVDVLLEDPLAFEADSSAPVKYAVTASGGLRQRNAPAAAAAEAAAHLSSNEPKAMLLPNRVFSRGLFADSFADVVPSSA